MKAKKGYKPRTEKTIHISEKIHEQQKYEVLKLGGAFNLKKLIEIKLAVPYNKVR